MQAGSFLGALLLAAGAAGGATISYTGTLASPQDDTTQITVTLASAGSLSWQTWGFGGGTNAASQLIGAGGFDPFVGLFSGTGPAAIFIDGTSDDLTNFAANQGCPPAGTRMIGGTAVCGDVAMSFSLAAGTYTVLLTDGAYIPSAAIGFGTTLGDGFTDLTSGFQTCTDATHCVSDTADWALDITTPDSGTATPEPGGLWMCGLGAIFWIAAARRRRSQI